MLRWIAILLMLALPLRSGLAAVQFCPWMAAQTVEWNADQTTAANSQPGAVDGSAGMAKTGNVCHLQKACAAAPILHETPAHVQCHTAPVHTAWRSVFSLSIDNAVPQPIPIVSS